MSLASVRRNHVIVFPKYKVELLGFPDFVCLSPSEHRAMALIHEGGLSALAGRVRRITIDRLAEKKLLDSHGLTSLGMSVAESCSLAELNAVIS